MYGYPEGPQLERSNSSNHQRVNSAYKKYQGMKDDEVIDYFNPTIGSRPGIKRDDSMKQPLTRQSSGAESINGNSNMNNGNGVGHTHYPIVHTHM